MYFAGNYNHQLDDKGRLRLPAKLRQGLGKSFVLMPGIDDTISIYPQEAFDELCKEYMSYDQTDVEIQRTITELISSAFPVEEDVQGRFIVPAQLRQYAKIQKNVIVKGALRKIEIWADNTHEARESNVSVNELMKILNKAKAKAQQGGKNE